MERWERECEQGAKGHACHQMGGVGALSPGDERKRGAMAAWSNVSEERKKFLRKRIPPSKASC